MQNKALLFILANSGGSKTNDGAAAAPALDWAALMETQGDALADMQVLNLASHTLVLQLV